jgi:hypothetical protein
MTCFNLVWIEGKRYYHCWFCNTWYEGQDANLTKTSNPYENLNIPIVLEEQEENETQD